MSQRIVSVALVLAVCFTGWSLASIDRRLTNQERQIETLSAAAEEKGKTGGITEQQQCATQAEKVFRQLGYALNDPHRRTPGADILQSHFNAKEGRCFMTIRQTSYTNTGATDTRYLLDAFEQRNYAEYQEILTRGGVQPALSCKELPVGRPETTCRSASEYDAIVKRYME